ncbi:MAG: hypothetical protein ABIO86_19935 [Sphingomonas sp.]
MPYISKEELPEILDIARRIADDCLSNGPDLDTARDFATQPLIAKRTVKLHFGTGRFNDLSAYGADSSIKLTIPRFGWNELRLKGGQPPNSVIALIASAVAHELVHERQEIANPDGYHAVVAQQNNFDRYTASTRRDYFDGYYESISEREAHATQAAVALWCEAELQGVALSPIVDPMTTEALRRPAKRMGVKGDAGDAQIDAWWDDVLTMAQADILRFS